MTIKKVYNTIQQQFIENLMIMTLCIIAMQHDNSPMTEYSTTQAQKKIKNFDFNLKIIYTFIV